MRSNSRRYRDHDDFPIPEPPKLKDPVFVRSSVPEPELPDLDGAKVLADLRTVLELRSTNIAGNYEKQDLEARARKLEDALQGLSTLRADTVVELVWRHRSLLVGYLMR